MIRNTRLLSQQLVNPDFDNPKDLVSWMGAIQAQDYNMTKWAVGIRLKSGTLHDVDKALEKGEILRTHIMRPTWHLVVAEDIRWMLKLCEKRIKSAVQSYGKTLGISEAYYGKCKNLLEKILLGNRNLTRQEIILEFNNAGIQGDPRLINHAIIFAETEGFICSGIDKKKKPTYALLDERIAPTKDLHKDEALALLAIKYFRSHSPASLQDFTWWSGLSITEARHALGLIESQLITDKFDSQKLFIHQSYNKDFSFDNILHFLPSFDEYLISYKERTTVLNLEHHPKAFTNNGIFYPVILYNGQIVGNWKKSIKKGQLIIEPVFFDENIKIDKELIEIAGNRYKAFMS